MQIFISYKSEQRAFAAQVRDQLRAWGYKTWFDQDDIPEGTYFRHEIQRGLESSDAVIGVMTAAALQSREVMWEWDYALYNSHFIPLRCEDVPLPYHLQGSQYIDFVVDTARGFDQLRAALINGAGSPPPPPIAVAPMTPVRRTRPQQQNTGVLRTIQYVFTSKNQARLARPDATAPQNKLEKSNREVLLEKVHQSWIEGVLEANLRERGAFGIGLDIAPGAVLKHRDYGDYTLPDSSGDVLQVFEDMRRELLILGAPGAGKTILMLQLAQKLIQQAQTDEKQPIPVVFNLSSWAAECDPIEKWLVHQLHKQYQVARKAATNYVEQEKLLLLLDGLDEVAAEHREDCVSAINAFRAVYRYTDMVVCSRTVDYALLTEWLDLTGAITLQPLSNTQVQDYLAGEQYAALRNEMTHDDELRDVLTIPFLLNTAAATYSGVPPMQLKTPAGEGRIQHLLDMFTKQKLHERGDSAPYSAKDTRHYLQWLAGQMVAHNITTFYLEVLQPSWLGEQRYIARYKWYLRIAAALFFSLTFIVFGSSVNLAMPIASLAVAVYLSALRSDEITLREQYVYTSRWQDWGKALGISTVLTALFSLMVWGTSEPGAPLPIRFGLIFGSLGTAIGALYLGIEGRQNLSVISEPNAGIIAAMRRGLPFALVFGVSFGGVLSVIFGVPLGLLLGMLDRLYGVFGGDDLGLQIGVFAGFGIGMTAGMFAGLSFGPLQATQHLMVRMVLQQQGVVPLPTGWRRLQVLGNYAAFLDHCADIGILRKVGGGYIFRHRYLLEYFAGQQLR